MFITRGVSSTRNTPAKAPPKGTTAELKMLLERAMRSRGMIGLRLDRHSTAEEPAGRSSHGMLGSAPAAALLDGADLAARRAFSFLDSIGALSFMRAMSVHLICRVACWADSGLRRWTGSPSVSCGRALS